MVVMLILYVHKEEQRNSETNSKLNIKHRVHGLLGIIATELKIYCSIQPFVP